MDYHLADDRLRGLGGVLAENGDPGIPLVPPLPEKAGEEAVRHAPCGVQLLRGMAGEVVRGGGAAPAGRPAFFRDAVGQQSEEGDGEGGDQRRARRERVRSFIGGSFLASGGRDRRSWLTASRPPAGDGRRGQ